MTDPDVGKGVKHGFSRAMYANVGAGRIQVTMPDGRTGLFDESGRWIEGEVYDVDPQMCVWMAAERILSSHKISPQQTKPQ